MKLTEQQEKEAKTAHDLYWESYLEGDVETLASLLDDHYTQIGSVEEEVFFAKKDAVQFVVDTIDQIAGNVQMRNRVTKLEPINDFILFSEQCDLYVLSEGEWAFYSKFRASSLMKKKDGGWKMIHQHSSLPDSKAQEGENIAIEKISAENFQLRDAIKRRTVELESKNRELQIEAALEKVRALTMAMHSSEDVGKCIVKMFSELTALGVDEDTRFGIGILNHDNEIIQLWTASKEGEEVNMHIGHLDMSWHPLLKSAHKAWQAQVALHQYVLKGEDLVNYYQMINNAPDYKLQVDLEKLPEREFHYGFVFEHGFFYAFNPREFQPELIHLTHRFSSLFEQTYRRYLDLVKAEAQAREGRIELALERVRARTMAMQHSDELKDAAALLFQQVKALGVPVFSCGYYIWENGEKEFTAWMTNNDGSGINPAFSLPLTGDANFIRFHESRQQGEEFYVLEMRGERMQEHYLYLIQNVPVFKETFENILKAGQSLPETQIHHIVNFSHGNVMFITFEPCPEAYDIFKRFGKVFEQTFTRFLDLQKAEAQAREAQIQLALERVRARTMAMQHSDELMETSELMFGQIKNLGIKLWSCGFSLWYDDDSYFLGYNPGPDGKMGTPLRIPLTEDIFFTTIREAKLRGDEFLVFESEGESLAETYRYMDGLPVVGETMRGFVEAGFPLPTFQVAHCGFFSNGHLMFITQEPNSEAVDIFKRFTKVFNQTYTRFLDLQKAEAQARDAQIQLGLERVRARAMAMQNSDELNSLIGSVFVELTKLDLQLTRCLIMIIDPETNGSRWWMANSEAPETPMNFFVQNHNNPPYLAYLKGWRDRRLKWEFVIDGIVKKEWDDFIFSETELSALPGFVIAGMRSPDKVHLNASFNNFGNLTLATLEPLSNEHSEILLRFANVFDLTYTRFNDLQKAEAQAREAEISLALERVRARTLAMQRSEELIETSLELCKQVDHLGIPAFGCGFNIWDADKKFATAWMGGKERTQPSFKTDSSQDIFKKIYDMERNGESLFVEIQEGEAIKEHYAYLNSIPVFKNSADEMAKAGLSLPDFQIMHCSFFAQGYLMFITFEPVPWAYDIFKRFAKVFEQTYTRFLDLKKAEAQAREAQIENALEKVRSRTMAMQHSGELTQVASRLFDQVTALGIKTWTAGFNVWSEDNNSYVDYITSPNGGFIEPYTVQTERAEALRDIANARKSGVEFDVQYVEGEKIKQLYRALSNLGEKQFEIMLQDGVHFPSQQYEHFVFGSKVSLMFITYEPVPEAHEIFKRLGKVFEQTYTRFLDLQKAEAQAREAQIEAALEKVRSRTMAMQHSDELAEAAFVLFQQLQTLGVVHERINIGVVKEESKTIDFWITEQGGNQINTRFTGRIDEPTTLSKMYKGWKKNQKFMIIDLTGEDLSNWLKYLKEEIGIPFDPAFLYNRRVQTVGFFSKGMLVLTTPEPLPEENLRLLEKFAGVFDLTYTRFSDLKHAEAQAREAQVEVALERIRARALAMQSSTELNEVTKVLRDQMGILGQEDLEASVVHLYSSGSPTFDSWYAFRAGDKILEGQATFRLENSALAKEFLKLYEDEVTEYTIEVKGEKLKEWLAEIKRNAPKIAAYWGDLPPEKQFYHFSDFSGGALLMVSHENLTEETRMLQKRCASVFELAYKRFLDLESKERQERELLEEKQRLEQALSELKSTQSQLIQSEKMASLGELTAGIAHEIQNPLNFVNNFSEVSAELIQEIQESRSKNRETRDKNQALRQSSGTELSEEEKLEDEILGDIKQNLEKITLHGKRADAIVKGMLEHSKRGSGQKQETDINALAEEFLRLSYQSYLAKDKEFSAELQLNLDPDLPKISVIPQDIGKFLLNLYSNAFYAVAERRKDLPGFENLAGLIPTVTVSTKNLGDKIEISVQDNGPGIPDSIKDKIFQPFFTTKPTGSGTGLGLSLSYDIVKAHGGELRVESRPNAGSSFIIILPFKQQSL